MNKLKNKIYETGANRNPDANSKQKRNNTDKQFIIWDVHLFDNDARYL